jgi:FtsP/CotA-like multicopper oxidase with cupredoxin domain
MNLKRSAIALALVALAVVAAVLSPGSEDAPAQGGGPVPAAPVTIDLCADEGTLPLPGRSPVDIWGFSRDTGSGCGPATLPGPVLEVNEDDVVTVNLHNNLSEPLSIVFPGQDLIPHAVVVPAGGTDSYTFTASNPGTYLYEADTNAPGTSAAVQVAMGLYGALIVRPAAGAYGPGTEYAAEEILVLSEIDPNLNNYPSGPNDFDFVGDQDEYTGGYHPTYFLINGEAHPETNAIEAADGDRLLLRYLNAGLSHHTMTLLGEHQRVIAKDAHPTDNPFDAVAETVPSGSTLDTITTLDGTDPGDRLPLYSRQLNVTNNGDYPGGMLTFIEVE